MRRYNYYDDLPTGSDITLLDRIRDKASSIDYNKIKAKVSGTAHEVLNSDRVEELIALTRRKRALVRLLAIILSILIIICAILIFSHSITAQNEKNSQFNKDAGIVCTDTISQYGAVKYETLDSDTYGDEQARLTGLCYARQMDFNNDGSDELMICYNDKNVYYLEVWGYEKKEFVKLYSQEANSTNDVTDGSWVGFYHKNNKYYICKSEKDTPEKVVLYALRGKEFKKSSECDYDYKDNIYSVKGKINAEDFETIKLSVIRSSKAEQITELVADNIEKFGNISTIALSSQKSDMELKADAYYEVVESKIEKYGEGTTSTSSNKSYLDGLCIVRQIDFNGDGNEELFLVYRKLVKRSGTNSYTGESIIIEEPTYCIEVYNWNGTVAKRIFSKDEVSGYLNDEDVNYIILKTSDSSTQICSNTYSFETAYTYTASSKIYTMKDESFEATFNARMEYDYGYRNYYIDNEYVYNSKFETDGYKVPMFLNDDGTYDEKSYTVIYLSGKEQEKFPTVLSDTVTAIQSLNKSYTPSE